LISLVERIGKGPSLHHRWESDSRVRRLPILAIRRGFGFGLLSLTLASLFPVSVEAYIGPGAGIAFVSSLFLVLVSFGLAIFALLTWPFRWLYRTIRFRRALSGSRIRRCIVLGLDGQDPELTDRFLAEGLLPNFDRLQKLGCYRRLRTSLPAESPVAWSSFQTGCNPGRHRVFDFLVPNRKTYLPELCSARVEPSSRQIRIGRYRIPLGKPHIRFERKSRSFWRVLSDHGIFSTILRVPITFPPEKFNGLMLSAMSVPDLRGTQGTFTYFTSDPEDHNRVTGGMIVPVRLENGSARALLTGPENLLRTTGEMLSINIEVTLPKNGSPAVLKLDSREIELPLGGYTPWITLDFRAGLGTRVRGISRFLLRQAEPHLKLYVTPISIAPARPVLPISHPWSYALYLAKTQGDYATLGMAEDTWALNERVLDEGEFLRQAYSIHEERERMFFDAFEKTRQGLLVCVFDITDRLQHMFFRYLDNRHPSNRDKDTELHRDAIRDLYRRMDALVGQVLDQIDEDTVLFVMSDHGFKSFRRAVNLNSWLKRRGYLVLEDGETNRDWFEGVDWTRSRAYAVGLGGIYLNMRGREAQGIVEPGAEAESVKKEVAKQLEMLVDPEDGSRAVGQVYDTRVAYRGPYSDEGPDLIVGFRPGYRASWSSATGGITTEVFEENTKSWSGDHCMNPPDVPGIFFANRNVQADEVDITDIGPTILDLFGVPVPDYCDGGPLLPS
jgi:predicted AlkP superfamily phosphohydrolase/phosphomutase